MREKGIQIAIVIVAFALTSLGISVLWLLFPNLKSEVAAAWIQAVGSIAALVGAIWISNRQHHLAIQATKRVVAEHHVLTANRTFSIAVEISILIGRLNAGLELASLDGTYFKYNPMLIKDFLDRLAQIEAQEPSITRATVIFDLRNLILVVSAIFDGVPNPQVDLTDATRDRLEDYKERSDDLQNTARLFLADAQKDLAGLRN